MTAYALTDIVSVGNVVQVTGSVAIDNVQLSASFNVNVGTSMGQGPGNPSAPWFISTTGSIPVTSSPVSASGTTLTVVTASFANVVLLQSNTARLGIIFTCDDFSSGSVYVKFGAGAATNSYSVKLRPGGYYEMPFTYPGEIDGTWDTNVGTLFITEFHK